MYWWLTCNLSHQLTSKTGLITFPLRLFGPQGSGSGFGSVCAVFLSGLHDPLPLNEGEQGWEMRHFRAQGFIPTAQWITLQCTKGRRDSILKKSFVWTLIQTILVFYQQGESLQTGYKALGHDFTLHHIFSLYPVLSVLLKLLKGEVCPSQFYNVLPCRNYPVACLINKCFSHILWSKALSTSVFLLFTFHFLSCYKYNEKQVRSRLNKAVNVVFVLFSFFQKHVLFTWFVLCIHRKNNDYTLLYSKHRAIYIWGWMLFLLKKKVKQK